jgi:hypothetical protein
VRRPPLLGRHNDSVVRYGELLGPRAVPAEGRAEVTPPCVRAFLRRSPGWCACVLVPLSRIEDARWDELHGSPASLDGCTLRRSLQERLRTAWWASPDEEDRRMRPVAMETINGRIEIHLPTLHRWGLIVFEVDETE